MAEKLGRQGGRVDMRLWRISIAVDIRAIRQNIPAAIGLAVRLLNGCVIGSYIEGYSKWLAGLAK